MASVISLSELRDIKDRYLENGYASQRDQDRRESAVWWTHRGLHDLRIPGRELDEWFDDFYAFIDKSFPDREIARRVETPNPPPIRSQITKRLVKQLYEDEKVDIWSPPQPLPITPIDYLEEQIAKSSSCGHRGINIQRFTHGVEYYRVICSAESCESQHAFDWPYREDITQTANELIRLRHWKADHNIIWFW